MGNSKSSDSVMGRDAYIDPDAPYFSLDMEGEGPILLSLRECRKLITLALTIPDLTRRIEIIEKARGTSHGR